MPTRGCADSTITRPRVKTPTGAGQPMFTIQRDYRELVPAAAPSSRAGTPGGRRVRKRPRDVQLTIDAGLQLRVCVHRRQLRARRRRARPRRSCSIRTPARCSRAPAIPGRRRTAHRRPTDDERTSGSIARVTARIRLDRRSSWWWRWPRCATARRDGERLHLHAPARRPRRRARSRGWSRPVRDDVLDTHPHGTIGMHDGLVHSCNAYFAQLAVSARARSRCSTLADRLRIPLAPRRQRRAARRRVAAAGRLRAGARSWPRRCAWPRSPRPLPPMACSRAPFVEQERRPASRGRVHPRPRRGAAARPLHAGRGDHRHGTQPAHHPRRSPARPARPKSPASRRTAGSSDSRRTGRTTRRSRSRSSSSMPATAARGRRRPPERSSVPRPRRG